MTEKNNTPSFLGRIARNVAMSGLELITYPLRGGYKSFRSRATPRAIGLAVFLGMFSGGIYISSFALGTGTRESFRVESTAPERLEEVNEVLKPLAEGGKVVLFYSSEEYEDGAGKLVGATLPRSFCEDPHEIIQKNKDLISKIVPDPAAGSSVATVSFKPKSAFRGASLGPRIVYSMSNVGLLLGIMLGFSYKHNFCERYGGISTAICKKLSDLRRKWGIKQPAPLKKRKPFPKASQSGEGFSLLSLF